MWFLVYFSIPFSPKYMCKYVMLNSFTIFIGRRRRWWWHWDCGASKQCCGKQALRTRDLLAARLLPMPASILLLVFIYYLQTRLADQSSTQVVTHLFCLCKLYEYDYRGGGLMVMVVSWLWWAGQKLCGIVDQSLDGLYSPLLKL